MARPELDSRPAFRIKGTPPYRPSRWLTAWRYLRACEWLFLVAGGSALALSPLTRRLAGPEPGARDAGRFDPGWLLLEQSLRDLGKRPAPEEPPREAEWSLASAAKRGSAEGSRASSVPQPDEDLPQALEDAVAKARRPPPAKARFALDAPESDGLTGTQDRYASYLPPIRPPGGGAPGTSPAEEEAAGTASAFLASARPASSAASWRAEAPSRERDAFSSARSGGSSSSAAGARAARSGRSGNGEDEAAAEPAAIGGGEEGTPGVRSPERHEAALKAVARGDAFLSAVVREGERAVGGGRGSLKLQVRAGAPSVDGGAPATDGGRPANPLGFSVVQEVADGRFVSEGGETVTVAQIQAAASGGGEFAKVVTDLADASQALAQELAGVNNGANDPYVQAVLDAGEQYIQELSMAMTQTADAAGKFQKGEEAGQVGTADAYALEAAVGELKDRLEDAPEELRGEAGEKLQELQEKIQKAKDAHQEAQGRVPEENKKVRDANKEKEENEGLPENQKKKDKQREAKRSNGYPEE